MEIILPPKYIDRVKSRSTAKYILGLVVRWFIYTKFMIIRKYATYKGAEIGDSSLITWGLAKRANKNLKIGSNVICETSDLDLRGKITIQDNCIINKQVQIIRVSHFIDNNREFATRYYPPLTIESYTWLCTGCHILPNVTKIASGTVVSAFTTLTHNSSEMDVIGSDGKVLRKHDTVFNNLITCSLCGGDYKYYKLARKL